MVPPAIAFLSALIKREGHLVELFDSTYYDVSYGVDSEGIKAQQLNVVPFDMGSKGIRMKTTNWKEDLTRQVLRFEPDLIAISSTEDMWELAVKLLLPLHDYIKSNNTPVIAGGVFPTFAPQIVLEHPLINIVCVGEGENAIVDLCSRIELKQSYEDVTNLCIKDQNGAIKKKSDCKSSRYKRKPSDRSQPIRRGKVI